MTDWNAYLGLPHRSLGRTAEGVDCYGLVRLVYAQELGINLPTFTGDYVSDGEHDQIHRLLRAAKGSGIWREVSDPAPFDVLLFRIGAFDTHLAVAVDASLMLHVFQRERSVIVRRSDPMWQRRYQAAYRHEARS